MQIAILRICRPDKKSFMLSRIPYALGGSYGFDIMNDDPCIMSEGVPVYYLGNVENAEIPKEYLRDSKESYKYDPYSIFIESLKKEIFKRSGKPAPVEISINNEIFPSVIMGNFKITLSELPRFLDVSTYRKVFHFPVPIEYCEGDQWGENPQESPTQVVGRGLRTPSIPGLIHEAVCASRPKNGWRS